MDLTYEAPYSATAASSYLPRQTFGEQNTEKEAHAILSNAHEAGINFYVGPRDI